MTLGFTGGVGDWSSPASRVGSETMLSPPLLLLWVLMDRTGALLLYSDMASARSCASAGERRNGGGGGTLLPGPRFPPPRLAEPDLLDEKAENPEMSPLLLSPSDIVGGGFDPDSSSSSSVMMALVMETPRLEMVDALRSDGAERREPSRLNLCWRMAPDDSSWPLWSVRIVFSVLLLRVRLSRLEAKLLMVFLELAAELCLLRREFLEACLPLPLP